MAIATGSASGKGPLQRRNCILPGAASAATMPIFQETGTEMTEAVRSINNPELSAQIASSIDEHILFRPAIRERLYRELLVELHRRKIATIDQIHDEARARLGQEAAAAAIDSNQAERDRWDDAERRAVEVVTRDRALQYFLPADIDDLVNLVLKREEVHSLDHVANMANVSFRELADKIQRFCELPLGETRLPPAEIVGTRVALTRHLLSDQLELIDIARNHLQIRDFNEITRRMIGSDTGIGRIGGKAGGMILAYHILRPHESESPVEFPLAIPESYYLRSDSVEDFLRLNHLSEYQSQKYKAIDAVTQEYPLVRAIFRQGTFPLRIVNQLRDVLLKLGPHPLIVRSSSLLEDRFGTAFCGKYASYFLANQGAIEQRLNSLLGAIAEVYASIFAPDPILYRREHNLIHYAEEMAILIQKVVGFQFGDYFLPAFAGVAFSRNEYQWSPRIRREDGMARIVMGLGTRAVDRSGSDYPRMAALGAPTLRPESSVKEMIRCAQHTLDVIDLKKNRFETIRVSDLLSTGLKFPMLDRIVSVYQDDELYPPAGSRVNADPSRLHITFDKLLRSTSFAETLRNWLRRLEDAYGVPIDMEFACDGEKLYVLQCRMQSQRADAAPVTIPTDVAPDAVLFDAHRYVRNGWIEGIQYVVYIVPQAYDAIPTRERRLEVARVVGQVNHALPRRSFILVGPGRWGSSDIRLGVPVRYADINQCRMLIEVARMKDGFAPEVSFGTHFFQDLVEAQIDYLPLYPDEAGHRFNEAFFENSPNILATLFPGREEYSAEVRVISVGAVFGGRTLTIAMDGARDEALAFVR